MTTEDEKANQELACAQTYVEWLSQVSGVQYTLDRAEIVYGGRWDFVACRNDSEQWVGIEVKSLVLADDRRQFNDWESFLTRVTKQLPGRVSGSYFLFAASPWQFRQQQAKDLVEPFIQALAQLDIEIGETANLGASIAASFDQWPTKQATHDEALWREHGIWKLVYPPEDLIVLKDSEKGAAIEVGINTGQVFYVDCTVIEALLDIFEPDRSGDVKPNVQLVEATSRSASETVLLLDCHMPWRPQVIRKGLGYVDESSFSAIDYVYLVDTSANRVERVRP